MIAKPSITVKQICSHCGYQWVLSQTLIKDTPAGNIILSAAILYRGETATKVLRVLSHMNIACITDRTYYIHQREYVLGPSSFSTLGYKTGRTTRTV